MLAAITFGGILGAVAACTSTGDISNPVTRKLTWFSFLNGDDIRATCGPGAPDHLRLVHNANYSKRIRVYEMVAADPFLSGGAPAGAARLRTRVIGGPTNQTTFEFSNPSRVFAPWAGEIRQTTLAPADAAAVRAALARDGLGAPAPAGTQLRSQDYWWLAVGCQNGAVAFQVWAHPNGGPNGGYDTLTFPALLAARDGTGIPLRTPADEPRHANPAVMDRYDAATEVRFRLAVGTNGINP
ncbi:hypothetical protein F1188_14335 [Roseospira marina]|uniref:Uncharacterized protein n=1 Tax=Roseospira marina TaxID=140057 RepID=A0A5M6IAY4_9PROT|nr:hypothetical protein [Roseospira marina]KAA5604788.1 hypothetical protein F1188_14335 [Roseospira marina]MBB4313472.1 hypothetical protein [Roseospira marina]MBB5086634.1 hypothetical protein [Roseospira marina]